MRCTAERRDHRYSEGALPVRREWHAVGPHKYGLDEHSGGCHPGARPGRFLRQGKPCNCRLTSHTATSYRLRGRFSSQPLSQDDLPQFLLPLPQAVRDGQALCHLSRQDTSRGVPSQGRYRSKVCASRRQQEPHLTAGAMVRQRVKLAPPGRRGQCVCSCVTLS